MVDGAKGISWFRMGTNTIEELRGLSTFIVHSDSDEVEVKAQDIDISGSSGLSNSIAAKFITVMVCVKCI